jgi:hypothetical protein
LKLKSAKRRGLPDSNRHYPKVSQGGSAINSSLALFLYLKACDTVTAARSSLGAYLTFHNTRRPHQLGEIL